MSTTPTQDHRADQQAPTYLDSLSALSARGFATLDDALESVLHLIVDTIGLRSSFMTQLDPSTGQATIVAAVNQPGGSDIEPGATYPLDHMF